MGFEATVVYYGVRHWVQPHEIELLETRTDPRIRAAMSEGLDHWWGLFRSGGGMGRDRPKDEYFLFLGRQIAVIGYEHGFGRNLFANGLLTTMREFKEKLTDAGIEGTPGLWVQFQPDY